MCTCIRAPNWVIASPSTCSPKGDPPPHPRARGVTCNKPHNTESLQRCHVRGFNLLSRMSTGVANVMSLRFTKVTDTRNPENKATTVNGLDFVFSHMFLTNKCPVVFWETILGISYSVSHPIKIQLFQTGSAFTKTSNNWGCRSCRGINNINKMFIFYLMFSVMYKVDFHSLAMSVSTTQAHPYLFLNSLKLWKCKKMTRGIETRIELYWALDIFLPRKRGQPTRRAQRFITKENAQGHFLIIGKINGLWAESISGQWWQLRTYVSLGEGLSVCGFGHGLKCMTIFLCSWANNDAICSDSQCG